MKYFITIASTGRNLTSLRKLFEDIFEAEKPPGYQGLLFAENSLRRNTVGLCEEFKESLKITDILVQRPGKSAALNELLKYCSDELLINFDDDIRITKGTIRAYIDAAKEFGDRAFFGGSVEPDFEESYPEWLLPFTPLCTKGLRFDQDKLDINKPSFLGFNWAVFANDLKLLGGYNELKGPGKMSKMSGQETDVQIKLLQKKYKAIYVSEAVAYHFIPKAHNNVFWVIKRSFRSSIFMGYEGYIKKDKNELLGIPKWVYGHIWGLCKNVWSKRYADRSVLFKSLQQLVRYIGYARGYQLRSKA